MLVEGGALYTVPDVDGDTPFSLADNEEVKQVILGEELLVYSFRQHL